MKSSELSLKPKIKKAPKNCSVIKVVDQRSVGNRDKITSTKVKKGLTQEAADKLASELNEEHKWLWPVTTFYVHEVSKKAA